MPDQKRPREMLREDVLETIRYGESSVVEFKRDDVRAQSLGKEIAALLNLEGGRIFLGIEDNGDITGLTRSPQDAELWVSNVVRDHVQPPFNLSWSFVEFEGGETVGIISLPADSPGKPYKARRGRAWVTYVRVGSSSREATRDEEGRLYQAARLVRYDQIPLPGTSLESLDRDWIENYLVVVQGRDPSVIEERGAFRRILLNIDFLAEEAGKTCATVAGLLLFGKNPNRVLPQAGITATAFPGTDKDYDTVDEERIRGPLVSMMSPRKQILEKGVIDRAVDFVMRNMGWTAWLDGARRVRKGAFPREAVRETLVNAVAHRDYTFVGTDVELSLYSDRLEVISPGRLPNGVTVEKMRDGVRAARNVLVNDVLRDYGYVEHLGMGVRNRIIRSMRDHNGTEPDLIEEEHRFTVRLWKGELGPGEDGHGSGS